ncbi:hypothetical protein KL921_005170 [Ogataea angusta]|uniref:Uncharacterized protein n=1 Tax=Pichia angusta TaxID=870730 RepID=A0AAN6I4S5_PICAN|nr:uncharacterized protein KL928_004671 [Ogataea angusta]KAG7805857.1 hypothetical protein KL921_005170 [Ogataea angusta]KAG7816629.1 hypothetical protein KL928_004671 [Ogataea angusta]KAG7823048.1 hypothetical protein KL909_003651 [Ogataea angusta]KAG7832919.1 hypothetical protein KL943_004367 [Ogataea angusta]KAG7837880.1 hypothetical protein KL942_004292 [Ogataea angusta]
MAVPPPGYDTVLLREHLYQDLKNRYLVIPPEAHEAGFRPVHEIGLGLFNYYLVDQHSIHGTGIHGIMEVVLDILLLTLVGACLFGIYKVVSSWKKRALKPVLLKKQHTEDLEKGVSSDVKLSYAPDLPSLVHSPATPVCSESTPSSVHTTPITNLMEFDVPYKHDYNPELHHSLLMSSLKIQ